MTYACIGFVWIFVLRCTLAVLVSPVPLVSMMDFILTQQEVSVSAGLSRERPYYMGDEKSNVRDSSSCVFVEFAILLDPWVHREGSSRTAQAEVCWRGNLAANLGERR